MKRNNLIIFICVVFLQGFSTKAQNVLTLKQAVEVAIKNNLEVRQAGLQMETSEINLRRSRANRYPALEGFAFQGMNQGRSIDPFTNQFINQQINFGNYGLNTSLTLFNGFSIHNTIRANALAYDASKMELQQNKTPLH